MTMTTPAIASAKPNGKRTLPTRHTGPPTSASCPRLARTMAVVTATQTTNPPPYMKRCGRLQKVSRASVRCHAVS